VSGPFTEDPTPPEPDPEWLARYEAKMADLARARAERLASRGDVEAWVEVERRVDEAIRRRRERS
jgi:hypothetical protein